MRERVRERETDRQTDRQTGRQRQRQTDRQKEREGAEARPLAAAEQTGSSLDRQKGADCEWSKRIGMSERVKN